MGKKNLIIRGFLINFERLGIMSCELNTNYWNLCSSLLLSLSLFLSVFNSIFCSTTQIRRENQIVAFLLSLFPRGIYVPSSST